MTPPLGVIMVFSRSLCIVTCLIFAFIPYALVLLDNYAFGFIFTILLYLSLYLYFPHPSMPFIGVYLGLDNILFFIYGVGELFPFSTSLKLRTWTDRLSDWLTCIWAEEIVFGCLPCINLTLLYLLLLCFAVLKTLWLWLRMDRTKHCLPSPSLQHSQPDTLGIVCLAGWTLCCPFCLLPSEH